MPTLEIINRIKPNHSEFLTVPTMEAGQKAALTYGLGKLGRPSSVHSMGVVIRALLHEEEIIGSRPPEWSGGMATSEVQLVSGAWVARTTLAHSMELRRVRATSKAA